MVNRSGETIPPYSFVRLTGAIERPTGEQLFEVDKPGGEGNGIHAITGPTPTMDGKEGMCVLDGHTWITAGAADFGDAIVPVEDEWEGGLEDEGEWIVVGTARGPIVPVYRLGCCVQDGSGGGDGVESGGSPPGTGSA